MKSDQPLHDLAALWAQVEAPAPHTDDLAATDATTQRTVAWLQAAVAASTASAPCPPPAARRLARRPRWLAPALTAAALLLVSLFLSTLDEPGPRPQDAVDLAVATPPEPDPPTIGPSPPDATDAPSAFARGLEARPSDNGLELRSGPVRLTLITTN